MSFSLTIRLAIRLLNNIREEDAIGLSQQNILALFSTLLLAGPHAGQGGFSGCLMGWDVFVYK